MVSAEMDPTGSRWIPGPCPGLRWLSTRLCLAPLLVIAAALSTPGAARGAEVDALLLLPGDFTLSGPEARQLLVAERLRSGLPAGQVSEGLTFESSDPAVVTVEDGVAVPSGNGKARITVRAGGREASLEATVEGLDKPFEWSFRTHVQAVLTKAGCNSGACHGAAAGKNGFRLSLRGYDTDGDYLSITRDARGRRISPAEPARSLVLLKPTTALSHKGGRRFDTDSLEYRVLSGWIAAGAPAPRPDDALVERIEVLPENVSLEKGARQQLVVRAHYTDDHSQDVTGLAKYTANNAAVVQVDDAGLVTVAGVGEGSVTVWYASRIVIARFSVPFDQTVPPDVFAKAERRNFIDEIVLEKLESLNLPPSPPADDATFLRRAFLDTIGLGPSAAEVRSFLADSSPDKRSKLIERLLERPELVDYWTLKWSDLLLVSSEKISPAAMWAYHRFIRGQVAANTPWDELARSVVTASGSTLENGAANFFVIHPGPLEMAETTSTAFLGLSIQCAKCHNHPMEKWTNAQYYGMANLFARVRTKDGPRDGGRFVFAAAGGDVIQPLTGRPQPPRPLDGEPLAMEAPGDRRVHLAAWLTAPENPYFSRAIVNRVWANFMGVGLVEAVDDLRASNPASNEKLLSAAAKHLVEHDYDLKALMRVILDSATYQRSSAPLPENAEDTRFYSRYFPRRLMAEVLLDAISEATGVPSELAGYPAGWRAVQVPDANIASTFLQSFGRPERKITCECERSVEPSIAQVLHIVNGDTINKKLQANNNRIGTLLDAKTPPGDIPAGAIIEELYLSALSRFPTDREKERLLALLAEAPETEKRQAIEDLFWSLLSSKEFLFNH
ncbi:MAG TPA: DUF1549 domain-containing protein [Planctomycetota bacterium]|nr:DUF1549 domain-containing protein [Planctomycetota bacterium]